MKWILIVGIFSVLMVSGCVSCHNDICGEDLIELERELCEKNGGMYDESVPIFGGSGYCAFFEGDILVERCDFRHDNEIGVYIWCN